MKKKQIQTKDINLAALLLTCGLKMDKEMPVLSLTDDEGKPYSLFVFTGEKGEDIPDSEQIQVVNDCSKIMKDWVDRDIEDNEPNNVVSWFKCYIHNRNFLLDIVKRPLVKVVKKAGRITAVSTNASKELKKAITEVL